jgi:hypothetical protein
MARSADQFEFHVREVHQFQACLAAHEPFVDGVYGGVHHPGQVASFSATARVAQGGSGQAHLLQAEVRASRLLGHGEP